MKHIKWIQKNRQNFERPEPPTPEPEPIKFDVTIEIETQIQGAGVDEVISVGLKRDDEPALLALQTFTDKAEALEYADSLAKEPDNELTEPTRQKLMEDTDGQGNEGTT